MKNQRHQITITYITLLIISEPNFPIDGLPLSLYNTMVVVVVCGGGDDCIWLWWLYVVIVVVCGGGLCGGGS